jgi:hypothetical protein
MQVYEELYCRFLEAQVRGRPVLPLQPACASEGLPTAKFILPLLHEQQTS